MFLYVSSPTLKCRDNAVSRMESVSLALAVRSVETEMPFFERERDLHASGLSTVISKCIMLAYSNGRVRY